MGRQSELVAIRVLREQDWAYESWRQRLSIPEISRRSALSVADGGLGYGLSVQQIRTRLDGYRDRLRPVMEANVAASRERQIAELSRLAQAALAKAASGGTVDVAAAKLLLDIHTREAKILGLDAPASTIVEVVSRDAIIEELATELAALGEDSATP